MLVVESFEINGNSLAGEEIFPMFISQAEMEFRQRVDLSSRTGISELEFLTQLFSRLDGNMQMAGVGFPTGELRNFPIGMTRESPAEGVFKSEF